MPEPVAVEDKPPWPRILSAIALLLLGLWTPVALPLPSDTACSDVRISANGASQRDLDLVSDGIALGKRFFHDHGIALRHAISLNLHPEDLDSAHNHIGLYVAEEARITLLTFDAASAKGMVFRSPMSETLYASFVVHELAHAIADQHFAAGTRSLLAHEYLAYVAQLSSLSDDEREKILQKYKLKGFRSPHEMSPLFYQLNPGAFGVKAYLHYRGLADPQGFVRGLLDGTIRMPGDNPNGW